MNRNKPVEQINVATKPKRQIPKGHRFSIKKTFVVHKKTMTPRSGLRWKLAGKFFKTVSLRWVPTRMIFTSSTTTVDSEPPDGSNTYITNLHECIQTLDSSACTSINVQEEQNLDLSAGRFLASFQDDAKYEHVGKDTRSQDGKDDQDIQGKDLKISELKTKSKDKDKGSRSKIIKHEGTSLQHDKDQRLKNLKTKQYQQSPWKQDSRSYLGNSKTTH
ncbi:hypothetical protein Tco_0152717 [Tanacetum coccineum]